MTVKPRKTKRNGETMFPEWRIWNSMVNRCVSNKNPAWPNYGGRGIKVCDRWLSSFDSFLSDMGRRPGRGWEIDRRDNNGDYDPDNCHWTTQKENSRNRRSARMVTYRGERMCLSAAAELVGKSFDVVSKRIDGPRAWSLEEALETPVRPKAEKGKGKKKPARTNLTGYEGVKKRRRGYIARVMIDGKRQYSRQYSTPEEAHNWYLKKREQHTVTTCRPTGAAVGPKSTV